MKSQRTRTKLTFGFILFLLYLAVFLGSTHNASAQNEIEAGASISPVVFELTADPGDTITNQIKIFNSTDYPQNIKIKVEDFSAVGEEGHVQLEEGDDSSTYSLAKWTTVSPSDIYIEPKTQQVVSFTISVPQIGEPGGHYGSIVAMISGGSEEIVGTSTASKRGSLVLLRVSGKIEEDIIVDRFDAGPFQEFGPVDFDLAFRNLGNVHVRPAGFITITDVWGNQVAQLEIKQNNVIPGAVRQAGIDWEEKNLMGYYTATVIANYGSAEKQTISAVTTFTVFPWKKGLLWGGIILVVIILLIKSRKRIGLALRVLLGKSR